MYTTFRYWVEQYFYVNQSMTETTYPREYLNGFLRTKPTRPSYDLAPPPPPSPLSRQQVVSHSQSSCVPPVELTDGRGGEGGRGVRSQTNHTTSRKLGHLQIIQYSLTYPIHLFGERSPVGGIVYAAWLKPYNQLAARTARVKVPNQTKSGKIKSRKKF